MAKKSQNARKVSPKDKINHFWVMINMGQPLYWKVTAEGIEKSAVPFEHEGPVITFDETSDFRLFSQKKIGARDARSYFLTEYQEKCRVFASGPTTFYGTPTARIQQFKHNLYPGAFYLDALIAKNNIEFSEDSVVGFSFQVGNSDNFNIVILFARRTNGEMSPPQVALNPPDLQLTIREFSDQYKASSENPILYGVDDVMGLQVGQGYPTEDMLFGTTVRTVKTGVAAAIGVVALGSYAFSGSQYLLANTRSTEASLVRANVDKEKNKISSILFENIHAFSRLNSVNVDSYFKYAESLWSQYSLVTSGTMDRKSAVLKARIPVQETEVDATGMPAVRLNDFNQIKAQLTRPLEPGLTRNKISLTQDANAYEVEYIFQPLDSDFSYIVSGK